MNDILPTPRRAAPAGQPDDEVASLVGVRNRYFTGKYLTADDFATEQRYFRSRHQLHNRMLHGWGVVCGLSVTHRTPDTPHCRKWVVVHAGMALDCLGRELVLDHDLAFDLEPYWEQARDLPAPIQPGTGQRRRGFLLCLKYAPRASDPVPVLYAEEPAEATRIEHNYLHETADLAICPVEDALGWWGMPDAAVSAGCRNDCDDDPPGPAGATLAPEGPRGAVVPLALITLTPHHGLEYEIDQSGRRRLPPPPEFLTHIVGINWEHGGEMTLGHLRALNGQLRVTFDRKLMPPPKRPDNDPLAPWGVNAFTFVVSYGGIQQDVEFLPFNQDQPPDLDPNNHCVAVFTIDPDMYRRDRNNIAGNYIYVTVKCDFILDCHGLAVDGNHLGGRLRSGERHSGNGQPGGTFESWFRVVDGRARPRPEAEPEREE